MECIQRLTWHLLNKLSVLDLWNLHNTGTKQYPANIFVLSVQFLYSDILQSVLPRFIWLLNFITWFFFIVLEIIARPQALYPGALPLSSTLSLSMFVIQNCLLFDYFTLYILGIFLLQTVRLYKIWKMFLNFLVGSFKLYLSYFKLQLHLNHSKQLWFISTWNCVYR